MTVAHAASPAAESITQDPQTRVNQATEQIQRALALTSDARLGALRSALQLNPYALKARYWLGVSLLQERQFALARQTLKALAEFLPNHASLKFYNAVAAIQDAKVGDKRGDLNEAEELLKNLDQEPSAKRACVLARLEIALRRKKNRPPMKDWLAWLDQIDQHQFNIPVIADKCAKFFLERDQIAEGDQMLAWLENSWLKKFPNAPLLAAQPMLHHIKYWQKDRWVKELQEQVFDEAAGDLVCLFILEKIKGDEQGNAVPEDKQLEELRALVAQLPGVSNLAYNYLTLLNTIAKRRLLTSGDAVGAATLWRESNRLDPFNTLTQFNLALAEAQQGKTEEYYLHWQSALRLAYWRWELSSDRQDWDLCVARMLTTADKLREEIDKTRNDNEDVPPEKILAWLKYLDLHALARQLTFDHPYHKLGAHADAPIEEARRIAQTWQGLLATWEARPNARAVRLPAELIPSVKQQIQNAPTASRATPSTTELAAFKAYCQQRAEHARDVFFVMIYLIGENRFGETRALIDRLVALPLDTLAPYLAEMKVRGDDEDIPLSNLINAKDLAERAMNYTGRYAEFLADEGDDQELLRQIAQIGNLPWARIDKPEEARRKLRERMAFAVVDAAAFEAINHDRWADAIPATEAALRRLGDQLDLLYLATLTLFRSVEGAFDPDATNVQWSDVRGKLERASGYCARAAQIATSDEIKARMSDLPEAVANALKTAIEMASPRGQAVRRARPLMKQEQWSQAYQTLNQIAVKDRNAEVEFYLGLCQYRDTQGMLGEGKPRPPLNDLKTRFEKAASHLRAARQYPAEEELKKSIAELLDAANDMLEQIKHVQFKESVEALLEQERWSDAYSKLSTVSKPDAVFLFYMALCRFRGVLQEFNQATQYNPPSIPLAKSRLKDALNHIRDARRICKEDDLRNTLDNLEDAVQKNLNILNTM